MKTADFDFSLPESLIAQHPPKERGASRLMCLNPLEQSIEHKAFKDLIDLIHPHDLLVFNNTKVIPARLHGQKSTGGQVELLVERILDSHHAQAHIRASKAPKPGTQLLLEGKIHCQVTGRCGPNDTLFAVTLTNQSSWLEALETHGHIPLPPYIDRADAQDDRDRYQTVYAEKPGAVAAPTAGLHFTDAILAALEAKGVQKTFVTLHVGAGTFQPVKVDDIAQHQMHSEFAQVSEDTCALIRETKARGGRVIAVGTTSVRSLETASQSGEIAPFEGETSIFLYPGKAFHTVDALLTNFHLPQSTLIMLVSAFAGQNFTLNAYETAVAEGYRFFSYGDAMFISHKANLSAK
jgi:S-adenosylmethionine:tRNA ribosyltransferase-isomerase